MTAPTSDTEIKEWYEAHRGRAMNAMLDRLLEDGRLPPYQLQRILNGELSGLMLGSYRILDELGEGGFGKVYKAVHTIMRRVVALKVIAPKWVEDAEVRAWFLREVVGMTRLAHPNIAVAYDANQEGDTLFLSMEYVEGTTLEHYVTARGPLPVPFACEVILQVACALEYTHGRGVVHRDIKPSNLLLAGMGTDSGPPMIGPETSTALVKVIDFGLARLYPPGTPNGSTLIKDNRVVGTPEFMAPEQAWDSHQVDIRSDLYSLGCTFYFALTGRVPFPCATVIEAIAQHLQGVAEPVSKLCPDLSPIVHRLMAKKPEQRFQTPSQLVQSLNCALRNCYREQIVLTSFLPRRSAHPDPVDETPTVPSRVQAERMDPDPPASAPEPNPPVPAPAVPENKVRTLWKHWLAIVSRVVQGGSPSWTEPEYKALHKALLVALRTQCSSAAHPRGPLYAKLENLVEPWLTLRSVADLDRETLGGLWGTCQHLDADLSPPSGLGSRRWFIALCLMVGLSTVLGLVVVLLECLGRMM